MFISSANMDLPRKLPGGLKFTVFFLQLFTLVGLGMFVMGMVYAFVFGSMVNFEDLKFRDIDPVVNGVILQIDQTNVSENKRPVFEYEFSYRTREGRQMTAVSYQRRTEQYDTGDTVSVEYCAAQPGIARITGMSRSKMSPLALIAAIVPGMMGLISLLIGIFRARRNLYLLKNGILTDARVTGKEETNTKINNRRVYKIFFEFTANGTAYRAFSKTHRVERVLDEAKEKIVYDSNDPNKAQMIDVLPKSVRRFFEEGV